MKKRLYTYPNKECRGFYFLRSGIYIVQEFQASEFLLFLKKVLIFYLNGSPSKNDIKFLYDGKKKDGLDITRPETPKTCNDVSWKLNSLQTGE